MASVEELLLNSLKDLETQDLKEFQWHIKKNTRIPNSEMENADRLKTVDKIVDFFGVEEAVKITIENLRKINKNNLAKELENKHRKAQAEGSTEDPELAGASSTGVTTVQVIQAPEYQTREEFLQCFHLFTLDPNTVHSTLYLSEGNTVITHTGANYRYPDHPDRFDFHAQALCRESISGRCYWEVEYSGREGVHIAVAYKSIKRKGMRSDSRFGYNNQSWRFYCSNSSSSFRHNSTHSVLPVVSSHKIGVYVDHGAGILSFFSVSDKMSLIHRVQTTFTQPLCVGFGVQNYTTLKMCRPIL